MDMRELRKMRDLVLRSTDFRLLPDAPGDPETAEARAAAWVVYRQALRDLPNNVDPADPLGAVVWPEPPEQPTSQGE